MQRKSPAVESLTPNGRTYSTNYGYIILPILITLSFPTTAGTGNAARETTTTAKPEVAGAGGFRGQTMSDCWQKKEGYTRRMLHLETARQEHGRLEHGDRNLPDPTSCAEVNRHQGRHLRDLLEDQNRHRRATTNSGGSEVNQNLTSSTSATEGAAYFSGASEVLQFKSLNVSDNGGREGGGVNLTFPRREFTAALWVQPEGGQISPVILMGLYYACAPNPGFIWELGMRSSSRASTSGSSRMAGGRSRSSERDIAVYFRLESRRSRGPTLLQSQRRLVPARWSHLAVTYDARGHFRLYVDGGRVAKGQGQRGPLFPAITSGCVGLTLGGSSADQRYFRGKVADLAVWGSALPHQRVLDYMQRTGHQATRTNPTFRENFMSLDNFIPPRKGPRTERRPRLVKSDVVYRRHDLILKPPPCGMTICDDPAVVKSYVTNTQLHSLKIVKYRIINLANDDGSNPTVAPEQIKRQDRALRTAFSPHNITFRLVEHKVRNTSLRSKVILEKCKPEMVGDGVCNCACNHPSTGSDGGDCGDTTGGGESQHHSATCTPDKVGDDVCDEACNTGQFNWDGGDCCKSTKTTTQTCRDPNSPYRSYMTLTEYKTLLSLPADFHLNIFFANWTNPDLLGIATFPWDRNVHSVMGGVVMQPDVYGVEGRTDNLVHELGHVFGLLHVHHGVSGTDCTDPCLETHASMSLGDLCEDTRPTPVNGYCRDPTLEEAGSEEGSCDLGPFTDTPYRNYMSYSNDACMDHFTPQQAARMHCYLDLVYQRWQEVPKPSPPPLPPRIVGATLDSVHLRWLPPIGSGRTVIDQICSDCREDGSLVQFALSAATFSPIGGLQNHMDTDDWAPIQATGPPDATPCTQSTLAWRPNLRPQASHALELTFRYPVFPRRLSIWAIFNAAKNIKEVELLFKDGAVHKLGSVTAQCDTPYTTSLSMDKLLTKIRIHVWSPLVGIDAVMVESEPHYTGCDVCPPIRYSVTREPPFVDGRIVTDSPSLVDTDVLHAQTNTYQYRIRTVLGSKLSDYSAPLIHTHGDPFCGDAILHSATEECDDGNFLNGDGCDLDCKTEQTFRCTGSPSVCVHHDGDGVCEESERRSSLTDCGFFTPDGSTDQWASSVLTDTEFVTATCPVNVVTGPPNFDIAKSCLLESFHAQLVWTPCIYTYIHSDFWLEAYFPRPAVASAVLVYAHLEAYVNTALTHNITLYLDLIDVNNATHDANAYTILNCDVQPLVFNVHHNLNSDFFLTKGVRLRFRSYHVGISGVVLRSRKSLSHLPVAACTTEQLYNPHTGSCVPNSDACRGDSPPCDPLIIRHGNVSDCYKLAPSRQTLGEGDWCHVQCHPGYEAELGDALAVCVRGAWKGATQCVRISCGQPNVPSARLHCPDGHKYGSKCRFDCKRPARRIGNEIQCEEDGLWSLAESFCQIRCSGAPTVKDAVLTTRARCGHGDQHVDAKCRFKCRKGFHVVGLENKRRVLWQRCSETGVWQGPSCERVHCLHLDHMLHGLYSCTDGNRAESTCTLKCPPPNKVTSSVTCKQDGRWDGELTRCDFGTGHCPEPPSNQLIVTSCTDYSIGSKCQIACNGTGYEPILASPGGQTIKHSSPGSSTSRHHVLRHVTCTGQQLWYPDIDDVTCVQQCHMSLIADGICQRINNRAHCSWDGGDCCASTTSNGQVIMSQNCHDITSSTTIPGNCDCLDPSAAEQQLSDSRYIRGRHYLQNYVLYHVTGSAAAEVEDYDKEEEGGKELEIGNGTPSV